MKKLLFLGLAVCLFSCSEKKQYIKKGYIITFNDDSKDTITAYDCYIKEPDGDRYINNYIPCYHFIDEDQTLLGSSPVDKVKVIKTTDDNIR